MSKPLLIIFLVSMCLCWSCASKRFVKQALKFEQAGHYEVAASKYYNAVVKNDRNLQAYLGLKKTGQITLEKKLNQFDELYNANHVNEAVLAYNEAEEFNVKLSKVNCQLSYPLNYHDAFNEVKNIYLEERYLKVVSLMESENFSEAEIILKEMQRTDPYYLDINDLKEIAHYEPLYTQGKTLLMNGLYRKAYYRFNDIVKANAAYKDAFDLKEEAYKKAIITLSIADVKNYSTHKGVAINLAKHIEKEIMASKGLFLKVIDIEKTALLKNAYSYKLSQLSGDNYAVDASKLLDSKVLLYITIDRYIVNKSKLNIETKKGFVKEKVPAKDELSKVTYKYHKVEYKEYKQSLSIACKHLDHNPA